MNNKTRKTGLGRGLSTLLAETKSSEEDKSVPDQKANIYLPIDKIIPNIKQPRKRFAQAKLDELSKSIAKNGIIQPVIVRPTELGYELVTGERRWRAAQVAKIHLVPAIIRKLTDQQVAEYAIVENIQREDLTPIEEAKSYKNLLDAFNYTQDDVANSLGKSRSYIANLLRLLTLPASIIKLLETEMISIGHARALVGVPNAELLAKKIIKEALSVRQTEVLVKRVRLNDSLLTQRKVRKFVKDIDTLNLEKSLSLHTEFKITINPSPYKENGQLVFNYNNLDELDRICEFLYDK